MAELVDALASGASGSNTVRVQISQWAPNFTMKVLWTDGSASPNPGPGGYAVIEEQPNGSGVPVKAGRAKYTTNICMEGYAILAAIEYADGEPCEIHTDSQFWIDTLTKWAPSWEKHGWRKRTGEIKNLALVKKVYEHYRNNDVDLIWVRGHVGTRLNELADDIAKKARRSL